MLDSIKKWLGLGDDRNYIEEYLFRSNMRAVVYMSVIVILLEIWMIARLTRIVIISWPRSFEWLFSHYRNYVILLSAAVVALIYAIRFLRGKTANRMLGKGILWLFSFICIVFGIQTGVASYAGGEQVLSFITMVVFVFCILYWRPLQSFLFSSLTFTAFYFMIDAVKPATEATQINLLTLWISTFMIAMSAYHQKVSEAEKAEGIEASNRHLAEINDQDDLTSLPNVKWFRRTCTAMMLSSAVDRNSRIFLFFDVERFKACNEKYGYKRGDELLQQIAGILKDVFSDDPIARVSDDHFVAFAAEETAPGKVYEARERVAALDPLVRLDLKTGGCIPAMSGNDVGLAISRARTACSILKRQYIRFYQEYDSELEARLKRREHIINTIDTAVKNGWIKVFYQPVVKCAGGNGELVGLEALARWDDPEYGLLPPYQFIETLEEYREIHKLDQCIIEQVCQHLREDIDQGRKVVPVSLNFSRHDFDLYDVPKFLHSMTEKYSLPGSLLDVEITESALTDHLKELQINMAHLRQDHFSMWLDDFGSGYSSLNVLKDFSFDVLKIDMMFLRNFNEKSVPIVTMIVSLAKQLNMVTLCEGVETEDQFRFLQSIGCDKAQGFYFSKPLPREEILKKYLA